MSGSFQQAVKPSGPCNSRQSSARNVPSVVAAIVRINARSPLAGMIHIVGQGNEQPKAFRYDEAIVKVSRSLDEGRLGTD